MKKDTKIILGIGGALVLVGIYFYIKNKNMAAAKPVVVARQPTFLSTLNTGAATPTQQTMKDDYIATLSDDPDVLARTYIALVGDSPDDSTVSSFKSMYTYKQMQGMIADLKYPTT